MEMKISNEAEERKSRSEKILKDRDIPINYHLPYIEDSSEIQARTKEDVAVRAMALLAVAAKAEGLEQNNVDELLSSFKLLNALTPKEKLFITNPNPSQFDKTQFIWRYEAAWVLLWSLGYVQTLDPPTNICDVPAAVSFMFNRSREQFIKDATLRSTTEILNENDLIYRYHWAVVDARINSQDISEKVDSSVVLERHYALNWLLRYLDQEWDDVSTDT